MSWRKKRMKTTSNNTIQKSQPLIIGNNALNINNNNFYFTVRESYTKMVNHENANLIDTLPTQSNIRMIQQIYLDLVQTKGSISISGVDIDFSDDIWDFSVKHKAGKGISNYVYYFNSKLELSDYQNVLIKLFAFYCITEYGIHNGTNKGRILEIKRLMEYMQRNNIELIDNLTIDDYKDFYEQRNMKYPSMIKVRRHIKEFLIFYSFIANDIYTKELSNWFEDIDTNVIKAETENNKAPLLPTEFYKKYTEKLYDNVINTKLDKWLRGYYGLLYIGTQTGLRASELAILRVQDLEVRTFKNKKIGILHYRSTKSADGKNKIYDNAQTNANQKVISVYEILESLFKKEREKYDIDFLVPRKRTGNCKDFNISSKYQITHHALDSANKRLCAKYCIEWDLLNSKDKKSFGGELIYNPNKETILSKSLLEKNGIKEIKEGDTISYPLIKQFRVYVASELRERGVDDRTTAFLFNHHCVEMYGYYARPKHAIQEDIDFSREIIRDVVQDKTKILGPKGDALTDKINKIIDDYKFNVEVDLDAIIEKVCNEVPIRAKTGGFCMKSNPRRECRHDAKTDEFMCAYGCCPNHCHMYFMLPITYEKVKNLYKTYEYNINAGFINAAEKEAYKLNFAINHELLPELIETKAELSKHSSEDIIKRHPEMDSVIYILEDIEKEVEQWKNLTEKN